MILPTITTKGRRGDRVEREYFLPVPPATIAEQLKHLLPDKRINSSSVLKLCVAIGELYALTLKQKRGEYRFSVSNKWAETIVSRIGGRRPLALLDALGITRIVEKHRATICRKATTREFCFRTFKPYKLNLTGIAARESRNAGKRAKIRERQDHDRLWVDESLRRVALTQVDQSEYEARPKHEKASVKFGQGHRGQNGTGCWNSVCNIPEDLRGRLVFDSETPVARLDISASFPTMLPWLFTDDTQSRKRKGHITPEIERECQTECIQLKAFLSGEDIYSQLGNKLSRSVAKSAFQRFLNAAELDPPAKAIGDQFGKLFPHASRMLRRRRDSTTEPSSAGSSVYAELYGRQSEIVRAVTAKCRIAGILCVPVHDELIAPFSRRGEVLAWLHQEIFSRTGVRAKVGGVRLDQGKPKTAPCPRDLCPDCWENRIAAKLGSSFPCLHQLSRPIPFPKNTNPPGDKSPLIQAFAYRPSLPLFAS